MPVTSIVNELKVARNQGRAIALFDVFELNSTADCVDAFERLGTPGIIAQYTGSFDKEHCGVFAPFIKALARDTTVPISIMLDHGSSVEVCRRAIETGFTDVMYDGSRLPFEENIENTRALVRFAHNHGVGVEAELGHVGLGNQYNEFGARGKGFTEPEKVEEFVDRTGVDMLAVAVGTAHGVYQSTPHIDVHLLQRIQERTDIPLVLHGGSGLSETQFCQAIDAGICKINIATDIVTALKDAVVAEACRDKTSMFEIIKVLRVTMSERCEYYARLFSRQTAGASNDTKASVNVCR